MIISKRHKYIFIGLPFAASSAISKELIEKYDGVSIFHKHTNIQSLLNYKDINVKDYFVFAVYRDPIQILKSSYSKYVNNSNNIFIDKKYLIENGGYISKKKIDEYKQIKKYNYSFAEFLKMKNKGIIPYDNVFSINEKDLDYIINFKNLQNDFSNVLKKIGLKEVRELPVYNKSKKKQVISDNFDKDFFYPFLTRNENFMKTLIKFNLKLIFLKIIYISMHPLRKKRWLELDSKRSHKSDLYFSKLLNKNEKA